jgi:hypothetical protein
LNTTLSMLASETAVSAPGSELVANRLADMLFIHSLRAHIGSQSAEACKSGLLRAIFDRQKPRTDPSEPSYQRHARNRTSIFEASYFANSDSDRLAQSRDQQLYELWSESMLHCAVRKKPYRRGAPRTYEVIPIVLI